MSILPSLRTLNFNVAGEDMFDQAGVLQSEIVHPLVCHGAGDALGSATRRGHGILACWHAALASDSFLCLVLASFILRK